MCRVYQKQWHAISTQISFVESGAAPVVIVLMWAAGVMEWRLLSIKN